MSLQPGHIAQSSTLPPAQPTYVLRGHARQIHALHFLRENLRLLSGDADGWVILWSISTKRPAAVWRAHKETILGLGTWGEDKIITHGRDGKLLIWQLRAEDEASLTNQLPLEDGDETSERQAPWLLHSLTINTLNFCSFAMCNESATESATGPAAHLDGNSILIATPGVQDGHIAVTSFPGEQRVASIPTPRSIATGMVMGIAICHPGQKLLIAAGYESGHAALWQQNAASNWETVYVNKAHAQPILSLDLSTHLGCCFTSAADANVVRHPLPGSRAETKTLQTRHAGQQSLRIRSDGKVFATAGWDGRVRVYSAKTMAELAVLKWHKEGCYAMAFAQLVDAPPTRAQISSSGEMVTCDLTVAARRVEKAKATHWLAVGSKDGKVSLWDIY